METVVVLAIAIFAFIVSLEQRNDGIHAVESIIPIDASLSLKALACIIIVCHHFALRSSFQPEGVENILQIGGNCALCIFLILSSYGITKSESLHPPVFKEFLFRRMAKILIQFWVVTAFVIVVAMSLPMSYIPDFDTEKVTPNFFKISCGVMPLWKIPLLFTGAVSINPHMWFVCVITFSYFLFFLIKKTVGLERKGMCVAVYIVGMVLFSVVCRQIHYPAHYWRNLWALVLGFYLALYEKDMMSTKARVLLLLAVVELYLLSYTMFSNDNVDSYMLNANIAMLAIVIFASLFRRVSLRPRSAVVCFSSLSYLVYLLHGSIFNVQWYLWGHRSLAFVLVVSVICAMLLKYPIDYILKKMRK